ncbi:hypothetical protein WJX84_011151 [Apatococcus fuscideae]|uniref:NADPH-dependent diflavin oxidoreductase 1 n=1 Tax=Apatococcus fuscideae TaxID=2026836 RepID=A0AAW1T9Y6_9CHLO
MQKLQAGSLLILHGTQSGNAQDVAERIGREARRRYLRYTVKSLQDLSTDELATAHFAVVVVSTTGQAKLPASTKAFWRSLLRRSLAPDLYCNLTYGVFGLGDSGYQNFNTAAKKLDRRLQALGARPLLPKGLADEQQPGGCSSGDTSVALDSKLCCTLLPDITNGTANGSHSGLMDAAEVQAASRAFHALESAATSHHTPANGPAGPCPDSPFMAQLLSNERITATDHFQDVRHLVFGTAGSGLTWEPGDALAILPRQSDANVHALLHRLGIPAFARVRIELPGESSHDGQPASIEVSAAAVVAGVVDVAGSSPRRFLFEVLAQLATEEREVDRLQYFASPEGRDDLHTYNQGEGRTLLEVLDDFKNVVIPLEWILQAAPRLKPRLFSLASAAICHPGEAHVCAAVIDYQTPHRRRKRGIVTSWLAGAYASQQGPRVPIWIEPGSMHLPVDPGVPLILISAGTGIAPFRAFLEHRHSARKQGQEMAPCYLYFGCRGHAADFYYADQWKQYQQDGVLDRDKGLRIAFSRDGPAKRYVTHLIQEDNRNLWQLIQEGANIYVAGSATKLAQSVLTALELLVAEAAPMPNAAAQKYVRQLEAGRRYFVEAW